MLSDTQTNNLSLSVAKTALLVDKIEDAHLPHIVTLQHGLWLPVTMFSLNTGPISKIFFSHELLTHKIIIEVQVEKKKKITLQDKPGIILIPLEYQNPQCVQYFPCSVFATSPQIRFSKRSEKFSKTAGNCHFLQWSKQCICLGLFLSVD